MMKLKHLGLAMILAISAGLQGCFSSHLPPDDPFGGITANPFDFPKYSIETIQDDFDGYTIHRMVGNLLHGGNIWKGLIGINAQRFDSKDGLVEFSLIVEYSAPNWLFIQKGESLVFLVDGKRLGFSGDGSEGHRNVISNGRVVERAWYQINFEDLKTIVNAKEIRVKVIGSQVFADREFTERNIKNLEQFFTDYVKVK